MPLTPEPADNDQKNNNTREILAKTKGKVSSPEKLRKKWDEQFKEARNEARSPLTEALRKLTGLDS